MTTRLLTLLALIVVVSPLPAQLPADAPLKNSLNADDLKRIGERVRGFGTTLDPKLLELIDKLVKDNPGLTAQQLALELVKKQPWLMETENRPQLQSALENLAAKAGTPMAVPTIPPLPVPVPQPQPAPPIPKTPDPTTPKVGDPPVSTPKPIDTPIDPPETVPNPIEPPVGTQAVPPFVTPPPPVTPPATTEQEAQFRAATGWWEQNVGPMSDSPALRELLVEFIKGGGPSDGPSPLASLLKGLKGEGGTGFKDFLKDVLPAGFKLPDLGLGRPSGVPTLPTVPRGRPDLDLGGVGDLGLAVAVGAAVALAAFVAFVALPWLRGRAAALTPTPVPGLGPWPLDPRSVTDRDGLVRAFDYLSVLTLGGAARQYSHLTIASELRRRVPAADDIADELGHYYEVARYTPPGEPVAAADLAAARAALCRLAGVPA